MRETPTIRGRVLQSRDAIELLADKWRVSILHALGAGPQRHRQLQRALREASPKMLTQTLRRMERDGLITRTVDSVIPRSVTYELTPMGESLAAPLRDLCRWAKAHAAERDRARREFDSRAANTSLGAHQPVYRRL